MTKLKLEVGKYYLTRDGRKVGLHINHHGGSDKWPFYHDCGDDSYHAVDQFGLSCIGCRGYDLIAEWTDTPTIGTLAEINAQVGDVLEFVEWDGGNRESDMFAVGKQYTHTGDRLDSWRGYFLMADAVKHKFRIIYRASDQATIDRVMEATQGPVITETVTRIEKHIVNGVYGKVEVQTGSGKVGIIIDAYMSRDDLTAAIETLTTIRDAM